MSEAVDWPAANCLRVDAATVEAVSALRDHGIEPVLLKGPVIAQWLYADRPWDRAYDDSDLLVAPGRIADARQVLDTLGFRCDRPFELVLPHGRPRHAECWYRADDGAAIDLHRCIHRTERIDPERVWSAASKDPGCVEVFDLPVATPGEAFRLVHLVAHIGRSDSATSRAWVDLERAIATVPDERWSAAVAVADELGLRSVLGPLLARAPGGSALVDRLGLDTRWPGHLRVEFDTDTPTGRFVAELAETRPSHRPLLVVEKVLPPATYLRATGRAGAQTRRGVAAAHVARLAAWRRRTVGSVEALRALLRRSAG